MRAVIIVAALLSSSAAFAAQPEDNVPPANPPPQAQATNLEKAVKICREQHGVVDLSSTAGHCATEPVWQCLFAQYEYEPQFAVKCNWLEREWRKRKLGEIAAAKAAQESDDRRLKQEQDARDLEAIDKAMQDFIR